MNWAEFDGGWKVLKGAALPTSAEPDQQVFYGAVKDINAKLWGQVVIRAVRDCAFFPVPATLREFASAIISEQIEAERRRKAMALALPDPRERVTFQQGHPDLPKRPNEGFLEYLERLSIHLGYATGAATEDPREEQKLAASMRADAERAPKAYWEER